MPDIQTPGTPEQDRATADRENFRKPTGRTHLVFLGVCAFFGWPHQLTQGDPLEVPHEIMPKLSKDYRFIDLSDYGRPVAGCIAQSLKHTAFTPIHVTYAFVVSGILAIACMLQGYYLAAGLFLILKSILDAADGELSRVKNTPSYTGRYLDSIFDILLNFAFIFTACAISDGSWGLALLAFIGIQLQGTLYNYYYVILRNQLSGSDTTSRVFESVAPVALPGESQFDVDFLFKTYHLLYGAFDSIIYQSDKEAVGVLRFPNWFMTAVSLFGLGFQLLIMAVLLTLGLSHWIVPFFIAYSALIVMLIGIRKILIPATASHSREALLPESPTQPCSDQS